MGKALKITKLMAVMILLVPRLAGAQAKIEGSARVLFDSANQERSSRGIAALKWDPSLANAAQRHASRMAERNTLSHQLPGEPDVATREEQAGARMSAAAENIAVGPSVAGIHTGWMNSPPHRHNLLDPRFDSIGIAVVRHGTSFFAVEDFSRALTALSLTQQENLVEAPIRAAGLTIRFDHSNARNACESGSVNGAKPRFVVQFSTTDLSTLPAPLERAVRSGQYVAAEVGACEKSSSDSLSQYHVAVLLY